MPRTRFRRPYMTALPVESLISYRSLPNHGVTVSVGVLFYIHPEMGDVRAESALSMQSLHECPPMYN